MKKVLWGAAALLAAAAPGVANADSASIGIHTATADVENSDELDFYGLDGAWTHEFGNGWSIQADGQHDRIDVGGETGAGYGAVAAGMRNDHHAVYGWVGLNDVLASSGISYGIGGELYFGQAVLTASYGAVNFEEALLPEAEVTSLEFGGTWFFTPNFGLSGELGWSEAEIMSTEIEGDTYGVGAVYRFDGTPFAINARYRHDDYDAGEIEAFLVGFSLNFGTETAQEQATTGPSWNGARRIHEDTFVFYN